MGKSEREIRERKYDEMERAGMTASFRNPPYYLTAAGMGRKEKRDGIRKETAYPEGEKSQCRI